MKPRLERAARISLKALSAAADPFFARLSGPRILIYHQVGTDLGREMEVATSSFTRQLDWMQSRGEIVDLDTAIDRRDVPSADTLFVLTFDDGYADVFHNAFPVMKERGIPFTLYLTTRPIEAQQPIDHRYPEARPMTWDHVNEMNGTGLVTIGAHTHTHPDLRTAGRDQILEELERSDTAIGRATDQVPAHFTYPWGRWSETADLLVRERYRSSTVGGTPPAAQSGSAHGMRRFPVQNSDGFTFFTRRMRHGLQLEERVRHTRARIR